MPSHVTAAPLMQTLNCDLCVIGAGSGGLSVAAGAAQLGRKVVLIEKGEMGGDCLNTGCVPSKSLIAAANRAERIREAAGFGIRAGEPEIDAVRVHAHIREAIAAIAPNDSQARFEGLGVTVVREPARFLDERNVEAGSARIKARRFVIATGSRPAVPPIPGLEQISYFTNETIFDNDFIPPHLVIIGAGPIGIELAQAHRRLGSQVTLLEAAKALPKEDEEAAALIVGKLSREGVRLLEGTQATSIARTETGARLQLVGARGSEVIDGTHILVAAGRKPNVEGLHLENAGVAYDAKGIKIDSGLKTSNRRIYAIGDIAGGAQFTHLAGYHASLVIRNAMFRLPVRVDNLTIPRVTFSDPELAQVGMTEREARVAHREVKIARADFADNDRAVTEREREGFIKVVVGRGSAILGATIVGAHAGELILPWVMAMTRRLPLSAMAGLVVPYPTLGDISRRAASNHYAPLLFGRSTRLLVKLLAGLG
jgi:pyruvate/2-oxoglutarate dehydrogenase complex dihydrolipoamide dehydrogenase (E3) component